MIRLRDMATEDVRGHLAHDRLHLRAGPFVVAVHSPLESLATALMVLYADFPVLPDAPFADFHIHVTPRPGLRRWVAPQAVFSAEGIVRHDPFRRRLAPAFFEWGLNGCISRTAHQYLVLHAAVLERRGRAVVLMGASGSGKSTLCAALMLRGWRLLSDELALLVPGTRTIVPLARPISLKNASIAVVRGLAPDARFGPATLTARKGLIAHLCPPVESVERMDETAELERFVFVRYSAGAPLAREAVSPADALGRIARESFNYGLRGHAGFTHLTRLVTTCPSTSLTYSDIDDAAQTLEHDAGGHEVGR